MNAYRNYNNNTSSLSGNLEKLSSGYKINRAGDDAAGLAISEKMRAQISGLEQAQSNVKDGISLVKTGEGAMQEVQDMLNRMVTLATQSANGTYDDDVDRANLQKEVDALKSEINRIADSSNFNGINLLDGKLGLNDDAFTISSAAATEQSDGAIDISQLISGNDHQETAQISGANPSGVIDLGDLSIVVDAGKTATIDFTIFGNKYTAKLSNQAGTAATTKTTGAIATALMTALKESTDGVKDSTGVAESTVANNNAIKINGAVYKLDTSAGTVTLEYAGNNTGTAAADLKKYTANKTGEDFDATLAATMNNDLGSTVSFDNVTNGSTTGDIVHGTISVKEAAAKVNAQLAGEDVKLTSDIVTDGGTLTIDGHKFTFQTKSDADTAATAGDPDTINVSAYSKTADQIHAAIDLLSQQTISDGAASRTWKIASVGNDTIHVEQTTGTDTTGTTIATESDFKKLISATGKATSKKNIGTTIEIDENALKEGDTLTIDGKTFVFTKDATKAAKTGYVGITGAVANLAAKAGTAFGATNVESDATAKTVTVRSSNAEATSGPSVLGKGVTLQIGDTSDSYNQLGLTINDIHTSALGLDGVSISDQEDAQSAIQIIKNAINNVSSTRGDLGALQNRLEHTANNLSVMAENIQDAESTIRDTDIAEEMMSYTKNSILVQSAQAMLAQANTVPQGVLQLLQ
jgi:flagellin